MEDPRIKQLEKEVENEKESSKAKFALVGFGRSTDLGEAVEKVEAEGLKLLGALNKVLLLEEASKKGADVGDALSSAQSFLESLKQKQKSRMNAISQDILNSAGKADFNQRFKSMFGKFIRKPSGNNFLKVKLPSAGRTKTLTRNSNISERKSKELVPKRSLNGIMAANNKFGSRVLKGLTK